VPASGRKQPLVRMTHPPTPAWRRTRPSHTGMNEVNDSLDIGLPDNHVLFERNKAWRNNPRIPAWVNLDKAGLDQFFTRPEIAEQCYLSLLESMAEDGAQERDYKFIEPSAGNGAFYNLLPPERRIGIDLVPRQSGIQRGDFLDWQPAINGRHYAAVGNPPFGYRAWLALAFMNHVATFADYVGFILPMSFQSNGKGSPKFRVKGLRLVKTGHLPQDSFVDLAGRSVKINALWQVWQRGVNNARQPGNHDKWLELFTVDMRKERLCGQERMKDADYFLQRTFYDEAPKLVKDFREVRYVCGYGLIIKKDKKRITTLLNNTDWREYSNLAAHNCRHISMYHIRQVLTDAGYSDD